MKQIQIKIGNNGKIEAKTVGMKGKECLKYIEMLERVSDAVAVESTVVSA